MHFYCLIIWFSICAEINKFNSISMLIHFANKQLRFSLFELVGVKNEAWLVFVYRSNNVVLEKSANHYTSIDSFMPKISFNFKKVFLYTKK